MAQWVKCLLIKHKEMSSNPPNPYKVGHDSKHLNPIALMGRLKAEAGGCSEACGPVCLVHVLAK